MAIGRFGENPAGALDVLVAGSRAYCLCHVAEGEGKETRSNCSPEVVLPAAAGAADDGDVVFIETKLQIHSGDVLTTGFRVR